MPVVVLAICFMLGLAGCGGFGGAKVAPTTTPVPGSSPTAVPKPSLPPTPTAIPGATSTPASTPGATSTLVPSPSVTPSASHLGPVLALLNGFGQDVVTGNKAAAMNDLTSGMAQSVAKAKSAYAIVGLSSPPTRYQFRVLGMSRNSGDVSMTFTLKKGSKTVTLTPDRIDGKWLIGAIS